VLPESLAKVKKENGALAEKLKETDEKAQMARDEVEKEVKNTFCNFHKIGEFTVGRIHPNKS
jgi:hypothetical protein